MTEAEKQMLIDNTVNTEKILTLIKGADGGGVIKEAEDGKKSRKRIHENVQVIKETMVTKKECAAIRNGVGARKDKILMRGKDVIILLGIILTILIHLGVIGK